MVTLPTFIPLPEAARKYGLEEARLRTLIEKGKIRAGVIAGEMVVSEDEVRDQVITRKEDMPEYQMCVHLLGREINIRKAAEQYEIPFSTLQGWVSKGIIRRLRETGKDVFVDEADVAYCSKIYKRVKGRGRRIFNADGTPYKTKTSSLVL